MSILLCKENQHYAFIDIIKNMVLETDIEI